MLKSTPDFSFLGCGAFYAAARSLLCKLVILWAILAACLMSVSSYALMVGHGPSDRVPLVLKDSTHSADMQHHHTHQNTLITEVLSEDCGSLAGNDARLTHCAQICFAHCQIALVVDFAAPDQTKPDKAISFLVPDWQSFHPTLQKPPPRDLS